MSIYENLCYRPKHDFGEFEKKEEVSDNWLCIRKMLGERLGEMQYTPNGATYQGWCGAIKLFAGANSLVGVELATKIIELIPVHQEGDEVREPRIWLTDVLNPFQIPGIRVGDSCGNFYGSSELEVFEDEDFVTGLVKKENMVHIYFYKKCN